MPGTKEMPDTKKLRSKIKKMLSEPLYRENAINISKNMKSCPCASGATDLIEKFIL